VRRPPAALLAPSWQRSLSPAAGSEDPTSTKAKTQAQAQAQAQAKETGTGTGTGTGNGRRRWAHSTLPAWALSRRRSQAPELSTSADAGGNACHGTRCAPTSPELSADSSVRASARASASVNASANAGLPRLPLRPHQSSLVEISLVGAPVVGAAGAP